MNTTSESRGESPEATPVGPGREVLVWDAPVRVFHWLMVVSFVGAYVTAESERWRLVHISLGYTMAGLVAFRIIWGLIGTRHSRFSDFVRGPTAIAHHVGGLLRGEPRRHIGHNPIGALAIVALLGLTLAIAGSGWAALNEAGGEWVEGAHELAANAMLAVIVIHVAGVLVASRIGRENLIGAMFTGRKTGRPEDGVRSAWRTVAMLMLAVVLGFWWLQWQTRPAAQVATDQSAASATPHRDRDDD